MKAQFKGEVPIDELNPAKDPSQFMAEANYFARCVSDNKEPRSNGEEGLRDMQLISEIYKSCGLKMG